LGYSFLVSFFINDPVKVYITDKFRGS
jgi:hypothetical protein